MLNVLLFIGLVFVFLVLGIVLYFVRWMFRAYHQVRNTFTGQSSDFESADSRSKGDNTQKRSRQSSQQYQGEQNETIFDTRSEDVVERKIFEKNEGEYIDYTEV